MKKVRIKKAPLPGDQLNYSAVGYGKKYMSDELPSTPSSIDTIKAVDKKDATIEAEKGETVVGDINGDGKIEHFKVGGKTHSKGGTYLNVPEGSFIFSNDRKLKIKDPDALTMFNRNPSKKGFTPAQVAKEYDLNKYNKILNDPDASPMEKRTAEMMISNNLKKLGQLAMVQEEMKGYPNGIPSISASFANIDPEMMSQMKMGGRVKYDNGGEVEAFIEKYPLLKDYVELAQSKGVDYKPFITKLMNDASQIPYEQILEYIKTAPQDGVDVDPMGMKRYLFPELDYDDFNNLSEAEINDRHIMFTDLNTNLNENPILFGSMDNGLDFKDVVSYLKRKGRDGEVTTNVGEKDDWRTNYALRGKFPLLDKLNDSFFEGINFFANVSKDAFKGFGGGLFGGAGAWGEWTPFEVLEAAKKREPEAKAEVNNKDIDLTPDGTVPDPIIKGEVVEPAEKVKDDTPEEKPAQEPAQKPVEKKEEKPEINVVEEEKTKREDAIFTPQTNQKDDRVASMNNWWTQDLAVFANEMMQQINSYTPMLQQQANVKTEAQFLDPSRNIAAAQSNFATTADAINQSADGQVARANIIAAAGQTGEQVQNIISQTQNANSQIANNVNAMNAQATARNIDANSRLRQIYVDQSAQLAQNYDDSRRELNSNRLKAWMSGLTNAQITNKFLPVMTPQFKINPVTGDVEYLEGKDQNAPQGTYAVDAQTGNRPAAAATMATDFYQQLLPIVGKDAAIELTKSAIASQSKNQETVNNQIGQREALMGIMQQVLSR